ncbi:MAG: DUF6702 family protein, partial [Pseudomonadota bacterium]
DPNSTELAFCQPNESENAEPMLLKYLDEFFYVKVNGQKINLEIKSKKLRGEGINTALGLVFEHPQEQPLKSLEVKNALFTDLFFDQNNVVYIYANDSAKSVMLNKYAPVYKLDF